MSEEMKCPFCEFHGHRMDLHAHLVEAHAQEVNVFVHKVTGKMIYELTCPLCREIWRKPLKKRPAALQEYVREIRMVAFDLFLYHLMEAHGEEGEVEEREE